MASNAFNIWLQLRGLVGDRVRPIPEPGSSRILFSQRETWQRTERYREVTMRERSPVTREVPDQAPARVIPPAIEYHEAPPEILYVKEGDRFVPVKRPRAIPAAIEASLR
jgi:hypothetical protein